MSPRNPLPPWAWPLSCWVLVVWLAGCDHKAGQAATAGAVRAAVAELPSPATSTVLGVPAPLDPTITFALPMGDDVAADAPLMLAFSEPMVALSALDMATELTGVTLTPPVPVRWRWVSTDTVVATPEPGWPAASEVNVRVATALRTRAGRPLQADLAWTFRTPPPRLVASLPAAGASYVARKPRVALLLDQAVDLAELQRHLQVLGDAESPQPLPGWTVVAEPPPPELRAAAPAVTGHDQRSFSIRFAGLLPAWRHVRVVLTAGLRGKTGTRATSADQVVEFATAGSGEDTAGSPLAAFALEQISETEDPDPDRWSAARLLFNAPIAPVDQSRLLSAVPAVRDLQLSCYDNECNVRGSFAPAQSYTFTVAAALEDAHGRKLAKPVVFKRAFGHRAPALYIDTDGTVMELHQPPHAVAVVLRNLKTVTARAWRVPHDTPYAVLRDLQPGKPSYAGALAKLGQPLALAIKPSQKPDIQERRVLDLEPLLAGKPGRLWLEVASPDIAADSDYPRGTDGRLYQVTDLHITAKTARNESLFWVTSLQGGQPLAGVRVELRDEHDAVTWRATTNGDGLATGPGGMIWQQAGQEKERRLTALLGDDAASLEVQEPHPWMGASDAEEADDAVRGWLFCDKPVYRAGDTVQCKGVVRLAGKEALGLPPAGQDVQVKLLDPQGNGAAEATVRLSARGTFATALALPKAARVGGWQVTAHVGKQEFDKRVQVAVFHTPRVKAQLELARRHVVRGEAIAGELAATWFSGGALAGAPVHVVASGMVEDFEPPGWPAFQFGAHDDADWERNYAAGTLEHEWKGETDAKGRAVIRVPTQVPVPGPMRVEVSASVRDPNGRDMASEQLVWLHPAAALVGVRLDSSLVQAPGSVPVHLIATDPAGQPQPGLQLAVQLVRREWKSVRVRGMGGETSWETRLVATPAGTCTTTSAALPVDCTLSVAAPGLYAVQASVRDRGGRVAKSSTGFYALGPDVAWGPDEPGAFLVADRKSYKVGDTARILVRNAAPGAWALVTEERAGIVRTRLQKLETGAPVLDVPIEARHAPTVHIGVAAIAGRRSAGPQGLDTGAPALQLDSVQLDVDPAEHRLQVSVRPERTKAQPGEKLTVEIAAQDVAGRPRAAEVALWAVDEGVLALTGEKTPDAMPTFYATIARGVEERSLMDQLVRRRAGELKGEAGGGGGDRASLRSNLRDVAFWQAAVELSADGKARHTFTLPDNLTTWRIMAVAVDGPGDFGSGDAQVEAAKPLMVQPATPRSIAEGDRVELVAAVRNRQKLPVHVDVQLAATGPLQVQEPRVQALELQAGESTEVRFLAQATGAGTVKLQWTAMAQAKGQPDVRDGVEEPLELWSPRVQETVASWIWALGDRTEVLRKDGRILPDVGGLRLAVSGSLATGADVAIRELRDYPYACTEQLASQVQAAVGLQALRAVDPKALPELTVDLRGAAQAWLDRILARRTTGGGFALWDGGAAHADATLWALWVLADARQAGLNVDDAALRAAWAWLQGSQRQLDARQAARATAGSVWAESGMRLLAVAAAIGLAEPATLEAAYAARDDLGKEDRLWLAMALARHDPRQHATQALACLEPLLRDLRLDAEAATLPPMPGAGSWSSPVQRQSLLVETLARVAPGHPMLPRLTRWLVRQQGGHAWGSTHDNAWGLRALVAQVQAGPAPTGDFALTVAGAPTLSGAVSRALHVDQAEVPQAKLPLGDTAIQLRHRGDGPLWLRLDYTYALRDPVPEGRNAGLLVRRQWFDLRGQPVRGPLRRGDHVIVQVEVSAGQHWDQVAIVDRPAAGLEPVDLDFAVRDAGLAAKLAALQVSPSAFAGACDARELAGREVRFFGPVAPGTQVYRYVARVATRGTFVDLGARAEVMYRPDVFGTSGAQTIRVE